MRAIWIVPVIASILILGTLGFAYGIGTDFLFKFGSYGSGDGQFTSPQGVAVDSSGNIYVADRGNKRIQIFNSAGVFQSEFGSYGSGDDQFGSPKGITLDSSGNIYIADLGNNRIQIFNSAGVFQSEFGTTCTLYGGAVNCHVIWNTELAVASFKWTRTIWVNTTKSTG